ncbi:DNA/RNA non-specific endonuclease [Enterococcus sp. DIV0660C]|uniref:DNA/RNA non-specific endonuclease n=1 Tax=Enterococcus sp. DIV0660C TaxID=2230880 RepID=UPI001A8D6CC0|nr:DNA/RNA non-specific endonuclease [Enterococcus sp. DIV0660C]MBO0431296.1 DNA/RNA non-specific endonuclease [Enterococcus sp. DIV0660C]
MNKKKKRNKKIPALITAIAVLALGGYEYVSNDGLLTDDSNSTNQTLELVSDQFNSDTGNEIDLGIYEQLSDLDFSSGDSAVIEVNNGQSTLDTNEWTENRVYYGDLDYLNRTTTVTAYIDKNNLGKSEGRSRQVWQPTGWNQKTIDGETIHNRGHLLAYTSSFNFDLDGNYVQGEDGSEDNPKNLATQTAYSNQKVQTKYEEMVRNAQKLNENKIVYQITTIFREDELMPRGYWLQAKDTNETLDFNVYEFNVQPKVIFDYATGKATIDRQLVVN